MNTAAFQWISNNFQFKGIVYNHRITVRLMKGNIGNINNSHNPIQYNKAIHTVLHILRTSNRSNTELIKTRISCPQTRYVGVL